MDIHSNHCLPSIIACTSIGQDRNPTTEKIALGYRAGDSNILGNATMLLTIENVGQGDSIFEAPEELVITQKVRCR